MSFAAVVPYRAGTGPERRQNAQSVLRLLCSLDIKVILAEHSSESDQDLAVPAGVERIHVRSEGDFNKAAACNAGFFEARASVVGFIDADMLLNPATLLACFKRVMKNDEVIRPFGSLVELSVFETADYLKTGSIPAGDYSLRDDSRGSEQIPACGGAFVIRSERYEKAGGMDERFLGWGGEDDAFGISLNLTGSKLLVLKAEPAFHLWHPRTESARYGHANYEKNLKLLSWWRAATAQDQKRWAESTWTRLEN